ncbi:methionine ABC transporter ATP-binding protein [uncultured Microbacterium sp.]|uniref:methionine ABC transporter ATP-binding protein n=3 Tax=uncultured Microbacterium sp. TaxID=191216 RepID=UPI00260F2518|nr:methionine ABC transporter ATP-binding protein [uncultured Microbacterium sp.]
MIQLDRARKSYVVDGRETVAVDDVSFDVRRGEILAIVGHSGAGKSTLARLINGLETVTSGHVWVDGVDIAGLPERRVRVVRRGTGMIFQQFNLFSSRTAAGNVAYPLRSAGWPKAKRDARVAELLDFVGLLDRAHAYPDQLSGGQKQRIGIARALATNPAILLADEATSALDPTTTADVLTLLRRVNREFGTTIVVITHELDVVRELADRVVVMSAGRVVEQGSTYDFFSAPASEVGRAFVAATLRDRPSPEDLERLRAGHPGRIVTADVVDDAGESGGVGSVLSRAAQHGVSFELLFGGISALQSRVFGALTIELRGVDAGIDAVIAELRAITRVEETAK